MGHADANTLSVAAFTALGTIVGYLGTEVASPSIFDRMLWSSRYFNDRSLKSFIAYVFLMPIGGPVHKAAVEALDRLVDAGLWKGYCRGDMLGTAFLKDTGHAYIIRDQGGGRNTSKEARNAFWVTVLSLFPWLPQDSPPSPVHDDEAAAEHVRETRSRRPVHLLQLSIADSNPPAVPVINGDIGAIKARHLLAILFSELITLIVGVVTAAVWKSPYSVWYLTPLLLKLTGLLCHVRRTQITPLSKKEEDDKLVLCEIIDISKGFFLIEGRSELIFQFFRHYGHPIRYRRGVLGDRFWEVMSMLAITATILVYPGGLIAFIFAPIKVQWVWLGYQLFSMLAMHMYRFGGGEYLGTTQEWVARELYRTGKESVEEGSRIRCRTSQVLFDDGSGIRLVAHLKTYIVNSVAEGREKVESLIEGIAQEQVAHAEA